MYKIKLYPSEGSKVQKPIFFDAGPGAEFRFIKTGGHEILLGNVVLRGWSFKKQDCFKADLLRIWDPSYFEFDSNGIIIREWSSTWCRDPRILMCLFLRGWVGANIIRHKNEEPIEEKIAFKETLTEDYNKLINPLPTMEEARDFLRPNGLLREDAFITPRLQPGYPPLRNREDYVNVPAKFHALVEKYKAR